MRPTTLDLLRLILHIRVLRLLLLLLLLAAPHLPTRRLAQLTQSHHFLMLKLILVGLHSMTHTTQTLLLLKLTKGDVILILVG